MKVKLLEDDVVSKIIRGGFSPNSTYFAAVIELLLQTRRSAREPCGTPLFIMFLL